MIKPRAALLIYGLYRELDRAVKSWKFLQNLDYDIYFSTYDYTFQKNKNLNINVFETVSEKRIAQNFPTAKSITIRLQDKKNNFLNSAHNSDKMLFHWKQCWRMLENSNKTYDQIYLIRPDLFFKDGTEDIFPNLDCNRSNLIWGANKFISTPPPIYIYCSDILFIGKQELIGQIINGIDYIRNYEHYFEYHLGKYLIKNDIYVSPLHELGNHVTVIRPNCRDLIDNNTSCIYDHEFLILLDKLIHNFSQNMGDPANNDLPF